MKDIVIERKNWYLSRIQVRLLTRSYGLNGTVIPYETECSSYVDINFSLKKRAKIGNLIIPCDEFWNPQVEISNSHPKKYYSIFMIDADFPVESERERRQLCHWARYYNFYHNKIS